MLLDQPASSIYMAARRETYRNKHMQVRKRNNQDVVLVKFWCGGLCLKFLPDMRSQDAI